MEAIIANNEIQNQKDLNQERESNLKANQNEVSNKADSNSKTKESKSPLEKKKDCYSSRM